MTSLFGSGTGSEVNVYVNTALQGTLPVEVSQTTPPFSAPVLVSLKGLTGMGAAGKIIRVNAAGNAFEYADESEASKWTVNGDTISPANSSAYELVLNGTASKLLGTITNYFNSAAPMVQIVAAQDVYTNEFHTGLLTISNMSASNAQFCNLYCEAAGPGLRIEANRLSEYYDIDNSVQWVQHTDLVNNQRVLTFTSPLYNGSSAASYACAWMNAGNVTNFPRLKTDNGSFDLEIAGVGDVLLIDTNRVVEIPGKLKLGNVVSDGTNDFTLPANSGTLALTSQLPTVYWAATGIQSNDTVFMMVPTMNLNVGGNTQTNYKLNVAGTANITGAVTVSSLTASGNITAGSLTSSLNIMTGTASAGIEMVDYRIRSRSDAVAAHIITAPYGYSRQLHLMQAQTVGLNRSYNLAIVNETTAWYQAGTVFPLIGTINGSFIVHLSNVGDALTIETDKSVRCHDDIVVGSTTWAVGGHIKSGYKGPNGLNTAAIELNAGNAVVTTSFAGNATSGSYGYTQLRTATYACFNDVNTEYISTGTARWNFRNFKGNAAGSNGTVTTYLDLTYTGSASWPGLSLTSDDRLKTNEEEIHNATDTLMKLRPQKYDKALFLDSEYEEQDETTGISENTIRVEYGFIAQEIYYQVPELRDLVNVPHDATLVDDVDQNFSDVRNDPDYSNWGDRPASVDYNSFIALLTKGFQEQQRVIEDLRIEVAEMKSRLPETTTSVTS